MRLVRIANSLSRGAKIPISELCCKWHNYNSKRPTPTPTWPPEEITLGSAWTDYCTLLYTHGRESITWHWRWGWAYNTYFNAQRYIAYAHLVSRCQTLTLSGWVWSTAHIRLVQVLEPQLWWKRLTLYKRMTTIVVIYQKWLFNGIAKFNSCSLTRWTFRNVPHWIHLFWVLETVWCFLGHV